VEEDIEVCAIVRGKHGLARTHISLVEGRFEEQEGSLTLGELIIHRLERIR
jgi:hypothetical protein